MELHGGCFCGGTRYVLRSVPTSVTDCHCLDCRHSSGAAFVTWGGVLRSDFEVTQGGIREILRADRVRGFAGCCGTLLTMSDSAEDEYVEVAIASLDEPARFRPEKIIWIEDKLPWVVLDPKLPAYQRNREQKP
jgi:hypothetical protein